MTLPSEPISNRLQNSNRAGLESIGSLRVVRATKRLLVACNLLHRTTTCAPLQAYLIAVLVGLVLLFSSVVVGLASFWVNLEIETIYNDRVTRTLDLGYLSQANYGAWYLVLCPVLLAILACAYDAMRKGHERYPEMLPSLDSLGKTWWIALIGILVFSVFVLKNIVVEWNDYKNLGLGWVQARPLENYRSEIEQTNMPIDLVAKGKKFDRFLLAKQDRFIQRDEIRSIKLLKVDPQLHVKNFWSMLIFIVATKFWAGLWEAIVIYFAVLTLVWGLTASRRIDLAVLKDSTGAFYHLSWIRRPTLYIFLVGLLVNTFCVLRYISNAVKGSYGKWDQYWSFLVFSPALFLIPFLLVLSTIFNSSDNDEQAYLSKKLAVVAGLWLLSFTYVVYLVLGYVNPRQQTILVACFKPLIQPFKKLCGL
jgi:hypothetical protein